MRPLVLCGLAPVLLAFLPAFAQEREAPARLPEIRVAPPPEALPPASTPSSVDTLTGPEVRRDAPAALPEALERLPGVSLQSEQGNRLQPNLSLRGFTISPVTGLPPGLSVFLDGVRLNEPTVEEVNFDLIPLEDVERVDVIRGPSVLFGRNTDRKSTRLNSSHVAISYAVFCLKKKRTTAPMETAGRPLRVESSTRL